MRTFRFKAVDAFTSVPLYGNPAGVVFGADSLSDGEMLKIANWLNLSETAFVQESLAADYRLRIFSPKRELPFAGHPTVAAAHAVREASIVEPTLAAFVQECKAGLIPITVGDSDAIFARVPDPRIVSSISDEPEITGILGCGSTADGISTLINVGPQWLVTRLADYDDLYGLNIDNARLIEFSRRAECEGITAYAIDRDNVVHVRTFAPIVGVIEDPVCGSGNAAVAADIRSKNLHERIGTEYTARQGRALGRDGFIRVRIDDDSVWIGGNAVTVVSGEIAV